MRGCSLYNIPYKHAVPSRASFSPALTCNLAALQVEGAQGFSPGAPAAHADPVQPALHQVLGHEQAGRVRGPQGEIRRPVQRPPGPQAGGHDDQAGAGAGGLCKEDQPQAGGDCQQLEGQTVQHGRHHISNSLFE